MTPEAMEHQAASLPPFFIQFFRSLAERARERARQQWLERQPWYRGLWDRARDGSGMREEMAAEGGEQMLAKLARMPDEPPQSNLQLYGSGGFSASGLIEGGGGVKYTLPLDKGDALRFFAGGGGAYGTIDTPLGRRDVHKFLPEVGLQYMKSF